MNEIHHQDEEWIQQTLAGNKEAFNFLIHRYYRMIYAYMYKKTNDRETAQDLTQETFVNAYSCLHNLKNPKKFSSWLLKIASNLCYSYLKKKTSCLSIPFTAKAKQHTLNPIEETIEEEDYSKFRQKVLDIIEELPENYHLPLMLRYLEEMSYQEIAQALHISKGAVVGLIFRGTQYLRTKLKYCWPEIKSRNES